jgi:Transcription termination factor nusG
LPLYTARRRSSDRVKELELPLFYGYVFCKLDLLYRTPVLTIPSVIRFVGIGHTPEPIEEGERISAIGRWSDRGYRRCLGLSEDRQAGSCGARAAPGLEGILLHTKGSQRLVLSVSLLQRSLAWNSIVHTYSRFFSKENASRFVAAAASGV